jgi:ribosomal protein bL25 (Ctc-form)
VLTVDLHAGQIQGFFNIPVDNVYASPILLQYLRERLGDRKVTVVSPDAGGVERARAFAKRLDAGLAVIDKRRARPGVVAEMQIIGDVDARVAVLVDDMVDTAGTLCRRRGGPSRGAPAVLACATHPVLSGPAIARIEASAIDELVITDTIPLSNPHGESQDPRSRSRRCSARPSDAFTTRRRSARCSSEEPSMETVEITIERRDDQGKGAARRMRAGGKVPGILYGPKRTTTSITVSAEEFEKKITHLEGAHLIRLVNAAGDGELHERMVLVREMQVHPVSGRALHADFYEVDLTERLTVSVTIHFVGKPVGVVNGGILQPILREIEVECLPTEIPDYLEVDVTALDVHDAVHASELTLPDRVTLVGDPTRTIVTVLPPSIEAKPEAPAAEAAAAPTAEGAPAAAVPEGQQPAPKKTEG